MRILYDLGVYEEVDYHYVDVPDAFVDEFIKVFNAKPIAVGEFKTIGTRIDLKSTLRGFASIDHKNQEKYTKLVNQICQN